MRRRDFISRNIIFSAGCLFSGAFSVSGMVAGSKGENSRDFDLYELFKSPESKYHPFVRWWWNGDKVEAKELVRELNLLKKAGVGGVEINPISFPTTGDDLGKKSLPWLSDEWIDLLQVTFSEAKKLDLTCDLIVGSGWPFGAEMLEGDERAKVVLVNAEKLEGPREYETSRFNIFKNVDPTVTEPYPGRTFRILSLSLVPDPMSGLDQIIDLTEKM